MTRLDNDAGANPFWTVHRPLELADPRHLVCEATELAHGRRHLTILHRDPKDLATSRHLSEFYEELRRLSAGCEWVRVRGNAEYVTVTVGGAFAEEQIALFEAAAAFANPGDWTIVASAVPPLS